jgi:murein DD-endopeptidase MepM/ murein hydrolase activator NlpD
MIHFAWRGNPSLAAIQAGPHAGYSDWKPGYFNIPLYSKGVTPCVGDWDIWAVFDGKTSARVQFHTDGRGGKSNQIEVNFALSTVPVTPPVVAPPVVTPPATPAAVMRWPLDVVRVTQWFGENPASYARFGLRGHNGVDFSATVGTPVKAAADGVVAWVDTDADYGNYIRIWHKALGVHSFYAHLSKQNVVVGATVKAGDVIGLSGNTGNSTGPHLHFELRPCNALGAYVQTLPGYGKACDPVAFVAGIERGSALGGSRVLLPFVAK